MILTFKDRDTEAVFLGQPTRRLPPDIMRSARRKLLLLHAATELRFLRLPPGNRLEALKGDRAGQHSIRINDQWRIYFVWDDGRVYNAEIADYH